MTRPKHSAPRTGSVADLVSRHLHKVGPMKEEDIYAQVDCGTAPDKRSLKIHCAIGTGWLIQNQEGKLACSAHAKDFYDNEDLEPQDERPIGQITPAPYRPSIFRSEGLSSKYRTNSRGMRQDQPEWSRRPEGFSFKTVSGSEG